MLLNGDASIVDQEFKMCICFGTAKNDVEITHFAEHELSQAMDSLRPFPFQDLDHVLQSLLVMLHQFFAPLHEMIKRLAVTREYLVDFRAEINGSLQ